MAPAAIVIIIAVFEYMTFAFLVGRARARYGVKAPATTGHEVFERYFRVQQNTLELLVMVLPSLWIAASYWDPLLVAAIGAVCLVGRLLYFRGYVREPRARHIGFILSIVPASVLGLGALVGVVRALVP